ncbi:MAG: N-acetylmuramoyl-L-alanine amidase [Nitrospira sp.]|uniref:N-acetylmuramoyl-L-alanine amidase n=1 Tax=Nitrospira defluvii TaxID=330214 RepID=A0ABM8QST0_9BACT|nr:N-acetylmuramoyl-L-alanine amidase [Nitrospira defluvii]MCS6328751.1 N-acetylmuramoyl-L-alanine amidase [Nitrospira sp.]CAE6713377.1 N-acetylmuramoyl-L-alanine amidase [Nitrospira defluvii]
MPNPKTYQFNLPRTGRPSDVILNEVWYPGIQAYWEQSTSSRIFDAILGIKAVVIHATAGSSSAGAISVMRDGKASFQWLVPDEDEPQHGQLVWACAPEARAAWHVRNACSHPDVNDGADKVNHWSLGIEVVNNQTTRDGFSDWQIQATAQIVRYCWAKYPNLKHVVSHAKLDPTRRSDPGAGFPWARLKKLVLTPQDEDSVPAIAMEAQPASAISTETSPKGCCHG